MNRDCAPGEQNPEFAQTIARILLSGNEIWLSRLEIDEEIAASDGRFI
jgi:hypothetical protein